MSCGCEIDHQLELGRQGDRQFGGVGSLEDAISVYRHLSEHVRKIDAVGDQATLGGCGTKRMDHRQPVERRQLID